MEKGEREADGREGKGKEGKGTKGWSGREKRGWVPYRLLFPTLSPIFFHRFEIQP